MKLLALLAALACPAAALADPLLTSWFTARAGQYARIYQSDFARAAGTSVTTWGNSRQNQTLPAYCGVQEIAASEQWVYVRSTGLGSHTMGPWYDEPSRSRPFVNLPVNQKDLFRLPRHPVAATATREVHGEIGFFVDGVHAFDSGDACSWSSAAGRDGDPPGRPGGLMGDRVWNRDAYVNEAVTFDPALAHQQNTGVYHYHANPVAPRFLLGDHVEYDSATGRYRESAAPATRHSPIVGWARDGYPIYGPYGYASATDPASGVRRMISGYAPRDGQHGTDNLAATGRLALPAWAARLRQSSVALPPFLCGPAVSAAAPLGRYQEDNAYLGDTGLQFGKDFDLDECNGRQCITPEYPAGTYAYFVTITAAGAPAYPYSVGRRFHGIATGGIVPSIAEPVTTIFQSAPEQPRETATASPADDCVALVWSDTEGGTYQVESAPAATGPFHIIATAQVAGPTLDLSNSRDRFFRLTRTALAPFDSVKATSSGGIISVAPPIAARGTEVTVTLNLDPRLRPPPPHAPILSLKMGPLTATHLAHLSFTQVSGVFTIPPGATPGPLAVSVTFPGPPDRPWEIVTYVLDGAFSVAR